MKKKKYNWFWVILACSFIIFVAYYIAYSSGYYEAKVSKKATITQERLEEFENDVKNNTEIDLKDYVDHDDVDYSSPLSRLGGNISSGIDSLMDGGVTDFFNFLGTLFAWQEFQLMLWLSLISKEILWNRIVILL